jgi:heme exporter protein A
VLSRPPERHQGRIDPARKPAGLGPPGRRGLVEDDALDALEQVGLAGREDLACKYLSQGQKRRVALARLVKERRPLWVLDEPFVALDVAAVDWLAGIISGHLQRGGLAVMTTHQLVAIPAGTVRECG